MQPPSLEILKRYAESGDYYSDCAQLALDRIKELEGKLEALRKAVRSCSEATGVDEGVTLTYFMRHVGSPPEDIALIEELEEPPK